MIIASLFVASVAAACGGAAAPPPPKLDPAATEVKAAMVNLANAKSFRAQLAAQTRRPDGSVGSVAFLYEFVPPDRYQLSVGTSTTRVVGGETFAKSGDTWTIIKDFSGSEYAGVNRIFDAKFLAQLDDNIGKTSTVVKGGTDTSEGKQCQMYTLTDTASGNKMDICTADNYPIRMVTHFGDLSSTALLRDFNANIVIDRPPV